MYKIQRNPFDESENLIIRKSDNAFIPRDDGNSDYQQFKKDVVGIGTSCVEGSDIVTPSYKEVRSSAYPPIEEQLDMMYWDKRRGTTPGKDKITEIKDLYPKSQVGVTSIADLPQWVLDLNSSS